MRLYRRFAALCIMLLLAGCAAGTPQGGPSPMEQPKEIPLSEKESNLHRVAQAARKAGDMSGAMEIYRQMTQVSTGSVVAHLDLASLYRAQRKPDQAVAVLRDAQRLQPNHPRVLTELGFALIMLNNPREALVAFDQALSVAAEDVSALNGTGVAYDMLGDYVHAGEAYRAALQLAPESLPSRNNLALSLILSDRYDEAIEMLEPLLERPNVPPTVRHNLALAYGLKGNATRATELGLRDLSPEKVEENIKFYQYYLRNHIPLPHQTGATPEEESYDAIAMPVRGRLLYTEPFGPSIYHQAFGAGRMDKASPEPPRNTPTAAPPRARKVLHTEIFGPPLPGDDVPPSAAAPEPGADAADSESDLNALEPAAGETTGVEIEASPEDEITPPEEPETEEPDLTPQGENSQPEDEPAYQTVEGHFI